MTPFSFLLFFCLFLVAGATVPSSKTFKFVNEGEFGPHIVEYGADYRPLDLSTSPFQLFFYNTTPNAFILSIRMGTPRSESLRRFVWNANRGNPVRENATLTFSTDGNLVLADSDGRVAWQTGTANKGVVGLDILSNGNLVLYDNKGKFVWQSFDYPSDTLLVGQSLRPNGPNKIVSRVSDADGSEGPYSLVLEKNNLNLYFKSKNSKKPLLYYTFQVSHLQQVTRVLFTSEPETDRPNSASELQFGSILVRPKYNSTLSLLRLGSDGSLKIYTYDNTVSWGAWEVTYSLFDRLGSVSECKLPFRCGSLGVCEDNQCVACPTPKGLLGWTKNCAPPKQPVCKKGAKVINNYYKVVGVEHFTNDYTKGDGPMKIGDCRDKCNKDCGCLGFFYKEESSRCLLAPELGTLNKVSNTTHVAYIKMSK